jgi:hypothetical protein
VQTPWPLRTASATTRIAGVVALASATAYLTTLLPGPGFSGDTVEWQFMGQVLGVPHPTGYPLYVLLNGLFVRLVPLGSLAWRANLLSAVCAVVAVLLVYRLARRRTDAPVVAAGAALTLAWTPAFWTQALVAEVYALNALLVAAVLAALARWGRTRRTGDLLLACGLYALSFGNHLTVITLLPAVAFLVLGTEPRVVRQGRVILTVSALVLTGASQYLLLLVRARDPGTAFVYSGGGDLARVWHLITGGDFHDQMFAFSAAELVQERLPWFAAFFWAQYGWLTPLVLLGAVHACRDRLGVGLLLAALGQLAFALNYGIGDVEPYFLPVLLIAAVWLAAGADALRGRLPAGRVRRAATWLSPAAPLALLVLNAPDVDRSDDTARAAAMDRVITAVPGDAVVLTGSWDRSTLLWYATLGERCCENLHVYHQAHPDTVARYLRHGGGIRLPARRTTVPTGLPVYAWGDHHLPGLQARGLVAFPVQAELFAVQAAPPLAREVAARHGLTRDLSPVPPRVEYRAGWRPPEHWGRWAASARPTVGFAVTTPPAELVVRLAPWQGMAGPRTVRALIDGELAGEFVLAGEPWRMQEFVIGVTRPRRDATLTLEVRDARGQLVDAAPPGTLPVGGISLRAPASGP